MCEYIKKIVQNKNVELKNDYEIYMLDEYITEMKQAEKRLTELCGDDEYLFFWIIEFLALVEKDNGIHRGSISLISNELSESNELPEAKKTEILEIVCGIMLILVGGRKIWAYKNIPKEETTEFLKQYRDIIDREFIKIFLPGEMENEEMTKNECDTIGDIVKPINNMSIEQ